MKQLFPIEPAGAGPLWVLAGIVALLGVVTFFLGGFVVASRRARIEVDGSGVSVRGDLYGRSIPWSSVDAGAVRVVDLDADASLALKWRTNGAGLPGYAAGWFRTQGGEKALVFVTNRRRVVVVPTREGYTLLFSPRDPEGLAAAIRRGGGAG